MDFSKRTRPGKIDPYRHPPVTCGSNKLYSMRSGHPFGNLFDRRAKPGEGIPRAQTLKPWVSQGLSTWAGRLDSADCEKETTIRFNGQKSDSQPCVVERTERDEMHRTSWSSTASDFGGV